MFKFINNLKKFQDASDEQIEAAMESVGLAAERFAKGYATASVDTGRLRNSLSHATHWNAESKPYKWGDSTKGRGTKAGSSVTVPKATPEELCVYLGTNVEYAPYVEMGTYKMKAQPFIEPAITNHIEDYKRRIKKHLKGN